MEIKGSSRGENIRAETVRAPACPFVLGGADSQILATARVDTAEMTGRGIAVLIPAVFGGLAARISFGAGALGNALVPPRVMQIADRIAQLLGDGAGVATDEPLDGFLADTQGTGDAGRAVTHDVQREAAAGCRQHPGGRR